MNMNETVVGVFLDENYAQQAVQALQASGSKARIADESAIKAFRGLGWEDEVVALYESRFNEGNSVVVVDNADGSAALATMLDNGAEYVNLKEAGSSTASMKSQSSGAQTQQKQGQNRDANYYRNLKSEERQYGSYDQEKGRARNAEEIKMQLRDETLTPVKDSREAGQVQIKKVVHEEQVQVPVTLRREEVIIERTPVNREVNASDQGITMDADQVIKVPVYEETVELQKHTRVREEVTLNKKAVEEQRTMSGTTRHEEVEVDQSGAVKVQGSNSVAMDNSSSQNQSKKHNTQNNK
ncbi:MAG: YsnF/AvaK domain-containing protein [Chloroflexia bacterium]